MNSNVGSTMVKKDKQDYSVNKAWPDLSYHMSSLHKCYWLAEDLCRPVMWSMMTHIVYK